MAYSSNFRALAALTACAALAFAGPASSQVSASERQQAVREHPQVLAQFGGAYEGPHQRFLEDVGNRVSSAAGLQGSCTFTLVSSDVVNAFAVPGCYVYVTRGLMSIANSEDELAFVMGHEIGHIAAKHSKKRQQRSLLTGLGAILLGAVTKNDNLAQLLGQGAQLYTLSFSREQEYEADTLGARYLARAGYSARGAAEMLDDLQRHDALIARTTGRDAKAVPQWASTHPLTAERVRRASTQAQTAGARNAEPQRDRYLSAIDGLLFGDDPAQGFVQGRSFVHPELRIAFDAPEGFTLSNSPQAVQIAGPNGLKAVFGGGRMQNGSLDAYAETVLRQTIGQAPAQLGRAERTTINGLEAVVLPARVQTDGGLVDLTIAAYRTGGEAAYHFLTLAPSGRGGVFDPMIRSMRRADDREIRNLRARVIQVVPVRPGDTVETLSARMAVPNDPRAWFQTLNNVASDSDLRDRRRVKVIGYGR
jgi:predicted Zn-dependent protease